MNITAFQPNTLHPSVIDRIEGESPHGQDPLAAKAG
jgi:hypothetical protein